MGRGLVSWGGRRRLGSAVMVALVLLSGCVSTTGEPPDAGASGSGGAHEVYGLLGRAQIESRAGQPVGDVVFWTGQDQEGDSLDCVIVFDDEPLLSVDIHYQRGYFKGLRSAGTHVPSPELILTASSATPLDAADIEGQGVTLSDDAQRAAIAWQYPDGHLLSMIAVRHSPGDDDERRHDLELLTELFDLIADDVPGVSGTAAPPTTSSPDSPTSDSSSG